MSDGPPEAFHRLGIGPRWSNPLQCLVTTRTARLRRPPPTRRAEAGRAATPARRRARLHAPTGRTDVAGAGTAHALDPRRSGAARAPHHPFKEMS